MKIAVFFLSCFIALSRQQNSVWEMVGSHRGQYHPHRELTIPNTRRWEDNYSWPYSYSYYADQYPYSHRSSFYYPPQLSWPSKYLKDSSNIIFLKAYRPAIAVSSLDFHLAIRFGSYSDGLLYRRSMTSRCRRTSRNSTDWMTVRMLTIKWPRPESDLPSAKVSTNPSHDWVVSSFPLCCLVVVGFWQRLPGTVSRRRPSPRRPSFLVSSPVHSRLDRPTLVVANAKSHRPS